MTAESAANAAKDPALHAAELRVRRAGEWLRLEDGLIDTIIAPRRVLEVSIPFRRDDGSRALQFTLDRTTTLIGAPLPHDVAFEIAAFYDPDGDIDSKDGQLRASAPARRGDLAIRMELGTP